MRNWAGIERLIVGCVCVLGAGCGTTAELPGADTNPMAVTTNAVAIDGGPVADGGPSTDSAFTTDAEDSGDANDGDAATDAQSNAEADASFPACIPSSFQGTPAEAQPSGESYLCGEDPGTCTQCTPDSPPYCMSVCANDPSDECFAQCDTGEFVGGAESCTSFDDAYLQALYAALDVSLADGCEAQDPIDEEPDSPTADQYLAQNNPRLASALGSKPPPPVSTDDYRKCLQFIGKEILGKSGKVGKKAKEFLTQLGCFGATTTKELAVNCMSLVCNVAPVPPCALLKGGKFLEACLAVTVDALARAIIPNTVDRLVDGWEGVDCGATAYIQSCRLCCRAQFGDDANAFLNCNDKCSGKPSIVGN